MRVGTASVALAAWTRVPIKTKTKYHFTPCALTSQRAGTARDSTEPQKYSSQQSVSSLTTETVFAIFWFSVHWQKSLVVFLKLEYQ